MRTLAPHTEAQPEPILLLLLATFAPGRKPGRLLKNYFPGKGKVGTGFSPYINQTESLGL